MQKDELAKALAEAESALARTRSIIQRSGEGPSDLAHSAASLFDSRRERDAHFPPGLFNEFAWDMLLVLFRAWPGQHDFRQSDLFTQAGVPHSTAIRTLQKLEELGLIEWRLVAKYRKPRVRLTDEAIRRMRCFLSAVR